MPPRTKKAIGLATAMGTRLRQRRNELGLTLSEVARRADISPSYLTAVETGSSTASLPVLARISHALETTIGDFLAGETSSAVKISHLGPEPGLSIASSPALQLQVAFQNVGPGESGSCPFDVEGASVVACVRLGQIGLTVDGEPFLLNEGDSLHAQSAHEVSWSAGDSAATIVWAVAPHGPA
jgi:transcriptional regulator with XRE-family HTH domain